MALRLNTAVVCGWIDNTTPGETRGSIEVLGMHRPLEIILKGNCARDLAGTRLDFSNPNPKAQPDVVSALHMLQRGVVVELSASQKVKSLLISQSDIVEYLEANKELPYSWKNCLLLKWHSITNGKVVIESTGFELKVSQYQWELDEVGERKQRQDNAMALAYFIELISYATEAKSQVYDDVDHEADEFEWERRLRARDSLEEAVDFLEAEEEGELEDVLDAESMVGRDELVQRAHALQMNVILFLGNSFLDNGSRGELACATQFIFETLSEAYSVSLNANKLEKGYQIAMLKRSVEASTVGVAACNTLEMEDDGFQSLRADIFKLRDMIMDRVRELRGEG